MSDALDFSEGGTFDADATRAMGKAYELACEVIKDRPASDKDLVARRIIGLAKAGERDPQRLCTAAVNGLPPRAGA